MNGGAILNRLTAAEVCHIIESCATHRVTKLQFEGLSVEFGEKAVTTHQSLPDLTQEQHTEMNNAQVQKDAEALRQLEIDELILTDPERYEELLSKGEI